MEGDKVKIGIIGAGQIGKEHLAAYQLLENVEVVAICDINEQELNRVAEQYHIKHRYTDFRQMLLRDDIAAVDVCLHTNYHKAAALEAFRHGKHVYCEKPLAGSFADGKEMLEAAKAAGCMLHVQLRNLYTVNHRVAKQLIEADEIGKIYYMRSTGLRRRGRPFVDSNASPAFVQKRNAGGGGLYDVGVYHISEIMSLAGNPEVERISGRVYQEVAMDEARKKISGYDVEETGVGMVYFKNGSTLDIAETWAMHLDTLGTSFVVGQKGGIALAVTKPALPHVQEIKPMRLFTTKHDLEMNTTFCTTEIEYRWRSCQGDNWMYESSQGNWIGALQGKAQLYPTAELTLKTLLIQEGIYLSHSLNREVSAAEVVEKSQAVALNL